MRLGGYGQNIQKKSREWRLRKANYISLDLDTSTIIESQINSGLNKADISLWY